MNKNRINRTKKNKDNILPSVGIALVFALSPILGSSHDLNKSNLSNYKEKILNIISEEGKPITNDDLYIDFSNDNNDLILDEKDEVLFLKERLEAFSFIELKLVDRKYFDGLHGDFLVKDESGKNSHLLYLPDDLAVDELPAIIKRVNEITFGSDMPSYASYQEIKRNIESAIIHLLKLKNDKNSKQIHRAVNNYYKIYQTYFPGENPRLDTTNISNNKDDGTKYFKDNLESINNQYLDYGINSVIGHIDEEISENIYMHFFESFFEHGSKILSDFLDLKSHLGLESTNLELEKIRNGGNSYLITKKEKEILNRLLKEINNYGFDKEGNRKPLFNTSVPADIIETKEITCVGFSLLSHQLLRDLGFNYNILLSPGHSSISVTLGNGERYLFDAHKYDKIIKYEDGLITGLWQNISYNNGKQKVNETIISGDDPEKTLISQILANKEHLITGDNEDGIRKKLFILERSINLFNKNPFVWYNIAYLNNEIGEYEKAFLAINKAIKISPNDKIYWSLKSDICLNKDDYQGYKYSKDMSKSLEK